jgi:beta-glucosidase-like glycosyl hydrolase
MVAPPDDWAHGPSDWLDELQPAGVILFRRHIPDELGSTRAAIARLQAWASRHGDTLLIAADEEGGFVSQISHLVPTPPSARALARATDPDNVRDVFTRYGRRMRDLGINLDFAPVCDVNNNPRNPVIGVRSFGREPQLVSVYARAVHEGLAAAGVLSCLKHFPGHGDTDVDSHLARPVIAHDRSRLDAIELFPFRELLDAAPAVMAAHVECPQLDPAGTPATLSAPILRNVLRDELGFQGVVVSDALEMQGVAGDFDAATSAVRSLQAGCDLLLRCDDIGHAHEAVQGIQAALDSGELSEARLDEAVARVDRLRALAVAGGDRPQLAEPLPDATEEAQRYRLLCGAALEWSGEPRWATMAAAVRGGDALRMVGWNEDVLGRFAARLEERGVRCQTWLLGAGSGAGSIGAAPARDDASGAENAAGTGSTNQVPADVHVLVLAERRPLSDQALAQVAELLDRSPQLLLANLLTSEVDEPIAARFDARLRSLDHSNPMLDTVADRWLTLSAPD